MGETLTSEWTKHVILYGNKLIDTGNYKEFIQLYKDLVNYFKPKINHNINEEQQPVKIVFENVSKTK